MIPKLSVILAYYRLGTALFLSVSHLLVSQLFSIISDTLHRRGQLPPLNKLMRECL